MCLKMVCALLWSLSTTSSLRLPCTSVTMCGVGSNWDTNLFVFDDRFTKTLSPWMILGYFCQREALILALATSFL